MKGFLGERRSLLVGSSPDMTLVSPSWELASNRHAPAGPGVRGGVTYGMTLLGPIEPFGFTTWVTGGGLNG